MLLHNFCLYPLSVGYFFCVYADQTDLFRWYDKKWWIPICVGQTSKLEQGMNIPGWWFQTFFIFHNIWDNPSHWLIFSTWLKPSTGYKYIYIYIDLTVHHSSPLFCRKKMHCFQWDSMGTSHVSGNNKPSGKVVGAQMVIFSIQPFNVAGQIWFKKVWSISYNPMMLWSYHVCWLLQITITAPMDCWFYCYILLHIALSYISDYQQMYLC